MKLVYETTGEEVKVGDSCVLTDEEKVKVIGVEEPHKPSSTGRVYVAVDGRPGSMSYFPSVIDAKWIERKDQG